MTKRVRDLLQRDERDHHRNRSGERLKSITQWSQHSWYIGIAYAVGFFVMLGVWKWHPDAPHEIDAEPTANAERAM